MSEVRVLDRELMSKETGTEITTIREGIIPIGEIVDEAAKNRERVSLYRNEGGYIRQRVSFMINNQREDSPRKLYKARRKQFDTP